MRYSRLPSQSHLTWSTSRSPRHRVRKRMSIMKLARRQFLRLNGAAIAAPVILRIAVAQAYPTRPVRIVVGNAPGGGPDIAARLLSPWLSERLGQSVIVENRPGAGGNLATETVVNSPA